MFKSGIIIEDGNPHLLQNDILFCKMLTLLIQVGYCIMMDHKKDSQRTNEKRGQPTQKGIASGRTENGTTN